MRNRYWMLLFGPVLLTLTACGKADDAASTSTQPRPGDTRNDVPETGEAGESGEGNTAAPTWDPVEPQLVDNPWGDGPAYAVGPGKLAAIAEMVDGQDVAQYTVRLIGELGLPIGNWSGALRNHESKIEMHISPGGRPQQAIGDGLISIERHDGTLHVFGSFHDANNDEEVVFRFEFEVAGYVASEHQRARDILTTPEPDNPLAGLLDDTVHNTPVTIQELFSATPIPAGKIERWYTSAVDGEATGFFMYEQVMPDEEGVTYQVKSFNTAGWYRLANVVCDTEGNFFSYSLVEGVVGDYTTTLRSELRPGSSEIVLSEYFQSADKEYPTHQSDIMLDTQQITVMPMTLEPLIYAYHMALDHDRFTFQTSDYSSGNAVWRFVLCERMPDETIEISGQPIAARVYRQSYSAVSTTDRVRSDSFGEIRANTLYMTPTGDLLKVTGDQFLFHRTTAEEAEAALGLSQEELLRPIPTIDEDGIASE